MSKKSKTILATILLVMALFQGPFFYYIFLGGAQMLLLVPFGFIGLYLTAYLFIKFIKYKSTTTKYHLIGLAITFIIGLLTIRPDAIAYIDFNLRKSERNKIIEQVKRGKLKPDSAGNCVLPGEHLFPISNGNIIAIDNNRSGLTSIEFYISTGFFGHYSAFLYTDDPIAIKNIESAILKRPKHSSFKKISDNWYREWF